MMKCAHFLPHRDLFTETGFANADKRGCRNRTAEKEVGPLECITPGPSEGPGPPRRAHGPRGRAQLEGRLAQLFWLFCIRQILGCVCFPCSLN
ncbi:hypothetical protein NDU88_000777 [Pleurodeles waltl]|uniref:Uncharacterized protein n=1 Tax=Pleurodeles waltl TaxID=8319 RepID=A0AAV7NH22_PLEWA|nr:hypothetical protein NDU88_000777 [Pleurodeles waltl]